jgi:riboflavin synthase
VLADNPSLTVRHGERGYLTEALNVESVKQPVRVILDGRNQLQPDLNVFDDNTQVVVVNRQHNQALDAEHIQQVQFVNAQGKIDLPKTMQFLGEQQINELWIEAGSRLAGAFIREKLVDRFILYMAPKLMGISSQGLCELPVFKVMNEAINLYDYIRRVHYMFTGIIEALGTVSKMEPRGGDVRLTVSVGKLDMSDVALGDSIAVNGVCLTAVEFSSNYFCADVSTETIKRTGFADYSAGQNVNLEKALMATSRLGGHIVSGHVDGLGKVLSINQQARAIEIWIKAEDNLARYLAEKGSITVDGVSLTVNDVNGSEFMLTLIPHTLQETIIQHYNVGTRVNLEVDVIARYVERLILGDKAAVKDEKSDISMAMLAENGYLHRR